MLWFSSFIFVFQNEYMDKILAQISVMILGELIRSPGYKVGDIEDSDVAYDAVYWANLLIKELNDNTLNK